MTIKDIVGQKIAIHCSTETKALTFLKACDCQGITWAYGRSIDTDCCGHYANNGNKTCYHITSEHLWYDNMYYYTRRGFQIIEFDDLDLSN